MVMRLSIPLILVFCLCQSCKPRENPRVVVLAEGVGVPGICELGDRPAAVRKRLHVEAKRTIFEEHGVGRIVEYSGGNFTFETLDEERGESVARVSVICRPVQDKARQPAELPDISTKVGLRLCPTQAREEDVFRAYGTPRRKYKSHQELSLIEDIKRGRSYSVDAAGDHAAEYVHYPAIGIAFVLQRGVVVKCSVMKPCTRTIWDY